MNFIIKYFFIALIFLVFTKSSLLSQTLTQGKVKFKIEYLKVAEDAKEFQDQLPNDFILYFNNNKSRMETNTPEQGHLIIITDTKTNDVITLIDLVGNKVAVKQSGQEDAQARTNLLATMKLQETNETKKIAGFVCNKALITYMEGEKTVSATVYYTKEITPSNNTDFPQIKGFLMEYEELDDVGSLIKVTAEEVIKTEVKDDMFLIPEGYTNISEEELFEMMGN